MKKIIIFFYLLFTMSGCATKQYPQTPMVTPEEASILQCKNINEEIAKVHSIQAEIENTGQFNGSTILGVLGDLGIGNGMAKSNAREKAKIRLMQLQSLEEAKCPHSDLKVTNND